MKQSRRKKLREYTFEGIKVCILATGAKEAYDALCSGFGQIPLDCEWFTDTYRGRDQKLKPTRNLWPRS